MSQHSKQEHTHTANQIVISDNIENSKPSDLAKLRFAMWFTFIGLVLVLLVSTTASASQSDLDAESQRFAEIMQGSNFQQQKRALEELSWSAVASAKVFDVVADKLASMKTASSKQEKQEAAWFARGLGYSGMPKYRAVLQDVADNAKAKKVRKYAAQALDTLNTYQQWNPIISANVEQAPSGQLQQFRVANMLAAQDPALLRLGAKRVYHGHKNNADLVAKAAQRLRTDYASATDANQEQIDALAWLIKVLAESGDKQYRSLLTEVAQTAKNKKLKKYAKKYQDYLS